MGLDMFAFSAKAKPATDVDFEATENVSLIATWRKHPNLHGWMERLYRDKGGKAEDFNCAKVLLTREDILALKEDVWNDRLPATVGFFFGASSREDKVDDLAFIDSALAEIEKGSFVFYDSWW